MLTAKGTKTITYDDDLNSLWLLSSVFHVCYFCSAKAIKARAIFTVFVICMAVLDHFNVLSWSFDDVRQSHFKGAQWKKNVEMFAVYTHM